MVTAYYWATDDPIDMIFSIWLAAYDVATTENYAFLESNFKVLKSKNKKLLWKNRLKVDLTKKNMTMENSIPLINQKTVKIFLMECFSKKYENRYE